MICSLHQTHLWILDCNSSLRIESQRDYANPDKRQDLQRNDDDLVFSPSSCFHSPDSKKRLLLPLFPGRVLLWPRYQKRAARVSEWVSHHNNNSSSSNYYKQNKRIWSTQIGDRSKPLLRTRREEEKQDDNSTYYSNTRNTQALTVAGSSHVRICVLLHSSPPDLHQSQQNFLQESDMSRLKSCYS